jgi:small subunit ribosomal protein S4
MGRYRGPKVKIIRRLGFLPGLTKKNTKNRRKTPGQHGKVVFSKSTRLSLTDDYRERLIEKQKLRFNYGVSEKQLISYYKKAKTNKLATGKVLLELLENRLDCIVYRLGFARTIPAARQLVNHGHICVNKKMINIPSFQCQIKDKISFQGNEKSKKLILENFSQNQQNRKLILRRLKRTRLKNSRFQSLLPPHLEIQTKKQFYGQVLSKVARKDVLVKINELKIVEYYSR